MQPIPGQQSLFKEIMHAEFSEDRVYRYSLSRCWGKGERRVNFVLLNPSTADETIDDNTIKRCMNYAQFWGFDGLIVTNLFAFRSTDPRILGQFHDPVGPENDRYILTYACRCEQVVCGWGNQGNFHGRSRHIANALVKAGYTLFCLDVTYSGQPKHPLRLKATLKPQVWMSGNKIT